MKVDKKKVIATIGALGLTAGVLAGCADDDDKYVKVVDSDGKVHYIEEDDYQSSGGGFFILYSSWNGHNHSKLHSYSKYKYKSKVYSKKPKISLSKSSSKK